MFSSVPWLPKVDRTRTPRQGVIATVAAAVLVVGVAVAVFVYPGAADAPSGVVRACAHANGLQAVVEDPTWEEAPRWAEAYAVAAEASGRTTLADSATDVRRVVLAGYTGDGAADLGPWIEQLRAVCGEEGGEAAWAADNTPVWHCDGARCDRGPEFIAELLEDFDV